MRGNFTTDRHGELNPNYKDVRTGTRLYRIWANIKTRCYNSNIPNYKRYGGRGITMCEEWKNNFQSFYDWSMSHGYSDELTLDRIDNDGNYEPSNCRWVTMKEQDNHRSNNVILTLNGESHTIPEWSEILGIKQHVIRNRINRGWSVENTLMRKVGNYVYKN